MQVSTSRIKLLLINKIIIRLLFSFVKSVLTLLKTHWHESVNQNIYIINFKELPTIAIVTTAR